MTMRRPRGDHEATTRRPALVLLSVFFPTFGLLLYYNTQAAHAYTHANTRPPRVHSREHTHTHTHPRGVHMVGGAPGGRSAGRTG